MLLNLLEMKTFLPFFSSEIFLYFEKKNKSQSMISFNKDDVFVLAQHIIYLLECI